jgi:hypothetical protein
MRGEDISHPVRILELSQHGFWVDLSAPALPIFRGLPAPAEQITDVQRPRAEHHWPALDIDGGCRVA